MSVFSLDAARSLDGPAWLVDRRAAAAEAFAAGSVPSTDEEVWRYSRIGSLDLDAFAPAVVADAPSIPERARTLASLAADGTDVVVTVDGIVASSTLAELVPDAADESLLGAAGGRRDHFVDLHDAFARPIQLRASGDDRRLVVIHAFSGAQNAAFPHLVVEAAPGARAEVLEVFVSEDSARHLVIPHSELLARRDATLTYTALQFLGDQAWMLGRLAAVAEQNATVRTGCAAFGGDYARLQVDTALDGRGAHGDITAGYFGSGSQLLDFRTFQDHAAPDTTSNLLFKGALGEKGASVYTGLIKIRPGARGSQAFQTNRNLKLSEDAWAESVPNLEIENNEVQCSHASTVSPVDAEQRFYLESRGVPTDRAERLIVRGFFDEVFRALPLGPFADLVAAALDDELDLTLPDDGAPGDGSNP